MCVPSNIKPEDRAAALRFASQALDALDAIHGKWILWEKTRPAATALKSVKAHLQLLVTKLENATDDHYAVAHDLGVIIAQLMVIHETAFLQTLIDLERKRGKRSSADSQPPSFLSLSLFALLLLFLVCCCL
jgi:hypothetical protein